VREAVLKRTKLGFLALVQLGCTSPNPAYRPIVTHPDAQAAADAEAPPVVVDAEPDLVAEPDLARPADLAPDAGAEAAGLPPTGLVGHWRLDEPSGAMVIDQLGNNPGILGNGAGRVPGFTRALFENPGAVSFDGQDDYVSLGVRGLPAMQAVKSVSVWCKAASAPATGRRNLVVFNNPDARESLLLGMERGFPAVWKWGPDPAPLISATRLDLEWHHLAYVYDGAVQRLYVDGTQVAWLPQEPPSATVAAAHLGTYDPGGDQDELWSGVIDDVRIYERALDPAEVRWLAAGND